MTTCNISRKNRHLGCSDVVLKQLFSANFGPVITGPAGPVPVPLEWEEERERGREGEMDRKRERGRGAEEHQTSRR